ncbi:16S rRNA (cytidine(1402)-2'-O)-methyltransferase [Loktanella sp. F6476L]|uniref:16S rRNA (cytidine(1402)-2'-O)-methyltransferase n=1 Tax=Loktanella sp. F6476L TaxID=2926405 RepID=UPI001FF57D40|nr:16S rRNA (cytidine(1402)-2'-O)-methyltransferase [Loktanella sp. F6476L]MCK0120330.1 16S rRNA (cytidine(1402)-2'-O)-methyltransferase [Loktanella sp. F6476L]
MNFIEKPLTAGLYFVATPIGSARDMTLRGLDILASADLIAAEDTRTARKLMEIHGVPLGTRQVVAYHDHSGEKPTERLVRAVSEGKSVAYVSEAGTPLVADPGYELGAAMIAADLPVTTAPGASAVLAALTVSGLATDRFAFIGFLPSAKTQRETEIAELRDMPLTQVFYESPKRLHDMLMSLRDVLGGDRRAVVCRELTKKFEETTRGSLDDLVADFADRKVKGEIVVLVDRGNGEKIGENDVQAALVDAMRTMRVKDAATMVAGAMGLPRRQVYQMALGLEKDDE